MGIVKKEIRGILTSKQEGIGTKSEGPSYWLEPIDEYKERWSEILIRKQTMMWQKDPALHDHLGKKVLIFGEIMETKHTITIDYITVKPIDE